MRQTLRKHTTTLLLCAAASNFACNGAVDAPHVDFGVSQPIGRWELEAAQSGLEDASAKVVPQTERGASGNSAPASSSLATAATQPMSNTSAAQGSAAKPNMAAAGRDSAMNPVAANGGKAGSGNSTTNGAAGAAAGSGAMPATQEAPQGVTSLAVNLTTEPVGGRYKPKNIGAVWISDSGGKLVKSLEVWAYLRLRYLTKYASARGSARPDVTASATLPNHSKPHMASWDLKDTKGAAVSPGKYTLNAELTDADATGKNISVEFDTSAGPMTVMAPTAPGFPKLELVLK